jgi:hypothetical protein
VTELDGGNVAERVRPAAARRLRRSA